jgi:hypothetical protein
VTFGAFSGFDGCANRLGRLAGASGGKKVASLAQLDQCETDALNV